MKTLIILFIPLLLLAEHKLEQYEVTYTIVYNSITLDRAGKLEKQIKKEYGDACTIDLKILELPKCNENTWYVSYADSTEYHQTDSLYVYSGQLPNDDIDSVWVFANFNPLQDYIDRIHEEYYPDYNLDILKDYRINMPWEGK